MPSFSSRMQRTTDGKYYPRKFQADYCMRDRTATTCMNNTSAKPPRHSKPPTPRVWRPKENQENNSGSVPEWEQEFTVKIGLFPSWERFIEAKKMIYTRERIMQWNDSAGETAFSVAKKRFWEKENRHPFSESMPNPNMYIDNIDWNSESDFHSLLSEVEGSAEEIPIGWRALSEPVQVKLEDIVPTGWDVDIQESGDLLTGLIVGDHEDDGEPALWRFRAIV